ncbi:MAG: hypothetical protein NTX49_03280 [Chlamydiae bacterium]|nr:hypothetical protein [Chlamydiota bacterium]
MESYLVSDLYDLVSPDGKVTFLQRTDPRKALVELKIENISPAFIGFQLEKSQVFFNIKSTLAQIGMDALGTHYDLDQKRREASVKLELIARSSIAEAMLDYITIGSYIGKLFAADERRKVRNPDYLMRMFNRNDRWGRPLLYLGDPQGSDELILEKIDGYTVAFLSLYEGTLSYDPLVEGFLPLLGKALCHPQLKMREILQLNQIWNEGSERKVEPGEILLVKTQPLHIRTAFGRVVESLLPSGFHHTSASVLEPDTKASGDVYELFGKSEEAIKIIPLEFYTLEPHREHVFFSDRDQLQTSLEDSNALFTAFETAPLPMHHRTAVFVVKGEQLLNLSAKDWIAREPHSHEFPGLIYHPERQAHMVERYIEQQPSYPFLKAMEDGLITSQGVLFCRYFPSPLMKKMLMGDLVQRCLKGLYFQYASFSSADFFSHEDRSLLQDLAKFAIPTYWVDKVSGKILQYVPKPNKDTGMFAPLDLVDPFIRSTSFGVYGSHRIPGNFEAELTQLLEGLEKMRPDLDHDLLNKSTPIALITGGGPGVMELGNRVAKTLGLLSCANIVDFRQKDNSVVEEQIQNPYVDIKMTYRLDRLVERQAEFNLDFPIFLQGGIGTDFEYTLEEVRRKVGSTSATPVLLFGPVEYWKEKITSRFQCNLMSGTIAGSEWVSNCFYCVQNAAQGLKIYKQFFTGNLPIGKNAPIYQDGFVIVK